MNIERVSLALVRDSAQPRDLVQANVDMLKASMEQVGLIQPIRVRPATIIVRGLGEWGFQIVAGHHRVAAARALGWTEIDAIVDTAEHLQAELMEIDENLCRAELTASQRAQAIRRRKQIWEALHPNSGKSFPTIPDDVQRGPGRPKEFAAETAEVSGESKRAINQHLARADALGDDLERITGTSLDKGTEMDALKAMPEPERKELIDRAAAGEKVSARVSQKSDAEPAKEPVKVNPAETFAADIHAALRLAMAKHSYSAVASFAEAVEAGYAEMDEHQRKAFEEMRDALMTVFEYVDIGDYVSATRHLSWGAQ